MNRTKDYSKVNDTLMGFIVLVVGIVFLILTLKTPDARIGNPFAPKRFPMMLCTALIILGAGFMFKNNVKNLPVAAMNFIRGFKSDLHSHMMIILTCIATVIYAFLFMKIGFVLATALFLMSLLSLTRREKWIANIIISVIFSVAIYVIFKKLLGVTLPPMPFIGF